MGQLVKTVYDLLRGGARRRTSHGCSDISLSRRPSSVGRAGAIYHARSVSDLPRRIFVALALGLPVALGAAHHGLGHEGDLDFFFDWYLAFREGAAFYRDGPGLNYPIVGVLVVCGPATLAERLVGQPLDAEAFRGLIKTTLVVGEIAMIFAAQGLARALGARRPHALALLLYALPSTWIGGAFFGQTDVVGTALLLLSAWGLIHYRGRGAWRHLAIGLVALHAALLAKQLTWFAAPALLWLLFLGLRERGRLAHWVLAALSPLLWFVVDPLLDLPDGYASHLWFVVAGGGSSHGSLAVASGASVWSLFVPGGTPSDALRWAGLDAFAWGWLAWGLLFALAVVLRVRHPTDRSLVSLAGVSHLAMATVLTGVHERYLTHAIPLLFLAGFAAPLWRRALVVVSATVAGLFVLASITPAIEGSVLGRPEPLALLGVAWLLVELRPPDAPPEPAKPPESGVGVERDYLPRGGKP